MPKGEPVIGARRGAASGPLVVEVPSAASDKPAWFKVGVIAAVGFVIGVAWPRLLGVRLGPSAPGTSAAASASASSSSGRAPEAPPASVAAPLASASARVAASASVASTTAAPAAPAAPPSISVKKGTVLSCTTTDGAKRKGNDCGPAPGIDQLVGPRIRRMATCAGVEGQTGKLVLLVTVDFRSNRFSYDVGKTSSLPNLDAVTSCLKTSFSATSTTATPHEHARYTVSYNAVFTAGAGLEEDKAARSVEGADSGERSAKAAREDKPEPSERPSAAPGEATVAWEVALVRDAPRTGAVLARLPRGAKVKPGPVKDGWYPIKFGDGYARDGWVYRGALGR